MAAVVVVASAVRGSEHAFEVIDTRRGSEEEEEEGEEKEAQTGIVQIDRLAGRLADVHHRCVSVFASWVSNGERTRVEETRQT